MAGIIRSWFGDFTKQEIKKFLLLGIIFAVMIGVNWLLRTLKDSAFITISGYEFIPYAKALSFIVAIPMVAIYGKLVDLFDRYKLFYLICIFYTIGTVIFAFFLMHPEYGIENTCCSPYRLIGWLWYVYVESYGSLVITLFWAFVSDITTPESAKKGFGIIVLFGQVGNILGPLIAEKYAQYLGTGILASLGALGIFSLIPLMKFFTSVISQKELIGFKAGNIKEMEKVEKKVDFAEGFGLLLARPYLMGIFSIVCFYEIIYAIFDYRFKAFAGVLYKGEALTKYLGQFGVTTGIVAFFCLLAGVSNINRWLGLTASLLISPIVMGILILLNITCNFSLIMWLIVFSNVINYALHQPTKEQLYIPTTHEAKYKTKAWIEIFGFRGAKALGSAINVGITCLSNSFFISTGISLVLVLFWLLIALFLGRRHNKALLTNKLIC